MEEAKRGISEDWLSFVLGMIIFLLSLGAFTNIDILGWGASNKVWTDLSKSVGPVSKEYQGVKGDITKIDGTKVTLKKADGKEDTITVPDAAGLSVGQKYEKVGTSPVMSVIYTYLFMMLLMGVGAAMMRLNLIKFAIGFTITFWIAYACWVMGHFAYIAALDPKAAKIDWSLRLSGEAGFIFSLLAGLAVGNFFPKFAQTLKEATKPELYVKTAIVIMGGALGVKAAQQLNLASAVIFRGLCAIVEAYLIYWALVYFMARKYFKFSREWAAPLASGISICGVSASIATGGAIRARPVIPIMVSSLVVIFAVVELIILPFMAREFLWQEPMVAGAWMGLAVKTDGAAVTSGAVTDALIRGKVLAETGVNYAEGWITMTATTVKVFIDIFIGVWAFVLAVIWCKYIECKEGQSVGFGEVWNRFPKFVLGYAGTFILFLILCIGPAGQIVDAGKITKPLEKEVAGIEKQLPAMTDPAQKTAMEAKLKENKDKIKAVNDSIKEPKKFVANATLATDEANSFRALFFLLTFFTIGVVSNFKKLWEEGIGKLAAIYCIALFGFIIWIGLVISWIFFHGVKPPVITG
ncbi:MAG TPA: putative sulfate exporter family transporter [Dissulfurispiraceae bacterium]|nr:putative sulfate exporter family transporter [Dissulfurispiraceae bacterium]